MFTLRISSDAVRIAIQTVVPHFDVQNLSEDRTFEKAGLDSLDHAQILIALEDLYGAHVDDGDFDRCNSIASIVHYFETANPSLKAGSSGREI